MANPNLLSLSAIYGKTVAVSLTSTNATSILSNASSSGKIFKINSLLVSNNDTSVSVSITINYYSAAALGGTAYPVASTVSVPAKSTIAIVEKGTQIYLEEDKSIGATAGTASKLNVVCSYEDLS